MDKESKEQQKIGFTKEEMLEDIEYLLAVLVAHKKYMMQDYDVDTLLIMSQDN